MKIKFMSYLAILACLMMTFAPMTLRAEEKEKVTELTVEGEVGTEMADFVTKQIQTSYEQGINTIVIELSSNGGNLFDGKRIIKSMLTYQSLGGRIIVVVGEGKICMSMCTAIFAAGGERYTANNSMWMFHSPDVDDYDKLNEIDRRIVDATLEYGRKYIMSLYAFADKDFTVKLEPYIKQRKNPWFMSGKDLLSEGKTFANPIPGQ